MIVEVTTALDAGKWVTSTGWFVRRHQEPHGGSRATVSSTSCATRPATGRGSRASPTKHARTASREPTGSLGRLSRDDLGYPLILLEEAAARCGQRGGGLDGQAFDPLALKAKLACAGSLLARGRRFAVARRAGEIVRLATLLIGHGRRDEVRRKVTEGRRLLKSYLGRN